MRQRLIQIGLIAFFFSSFCISQVTEIPPVPKKDLNRFYPLSMQQIMDSTTLSEDIQMDEFRDSQTHPNTQLRWVKARFFSHRWKDGDWHAKITLVLPERISRKRRGMLVICPTGSINTVPGIELTRDYHEFIASEYGVPVMSIPFAGEHYGSSDIHDWSDFANYMFADLGGDPSWLAQYSTGVVRSRALTLVGKLLGHPIERVIHLGSSITAGQAWRWSTFDPRVFGLAATGSVGSFRHMFPRDGSHHSNRPYLDQLTTIPEDLLVLFEQCRDPAVFGPEITCPVLQLAGTNDPACPPSLLPNLLKALGGNSHLVQIPNYGHGCGSMRHIESMRMLLDRWLLGRKLSRVNIQNRQVENGLLQCTAQVHGKSQVAEVRLYYATFSDPNTFDSENLPETPESNYEDLIWRSVPMTQEADGWKASLELSDSSDRFVAFFVDVRDTFRGRNGYASTPIEALPK